MKIRDIQDIEKLDFEKGGGLIPAIIQDASTEQVLMLGYANREALEKTLQSGLVWFYSRRKGRLWQKGESSGHVLAVVEIHADCDQDTILVRADPAGPTCHTGSQSCFGTGTGEMHFLADLDRLIRERKATLPADSYTTRLFQDGIERIVQKVGEEATETVIAALAQGETDLLNEAADLLYHLDVLLVEKGLSLGQVVKILADRHKKSD